MVCNKQMILIKYHFLRVVHTEAIHGQSDLELLKMSKGNMGSQLP